MIGKESDTASLLVIKYLQLTNVMIPDFTVPARNIGNRLISNSTKFDFDYVLVHFFVKK